MRNLIYCIHFILLFMQTMKWKCFFLDSIRFVVLFFIFILLLNKHAISALYVSYSNFIQRCLLVKLVWILECNIRNIVATFQMWRSQFVRLTISWLFLFGWLLVLLTIGTKYVNILNERELSHSIYMYILKFIPFLFATPLLRYRKYKFMLFCFCEWGSEHKLSITQHVLVIMYAVPCD